MSSEIKLINMESCKDAVPEPVDGQSENSLSESPESNLISEGTADNSDTLSNANACDKILQPMYFREKKEICSDVVVKNEKPDSLQAFVSSESMIRSASSFSFHSEEMLPSASDFAVNFDLRRSTTERSTALDELYAVSANSSLPAVHSFEIEDYLGLKAMISDVANRCFSESVLSSTYEYFHDIGGRESQSTVDSRLRSEEQNLVVSYTRNWSNEKNSSEEKLFNWSSRVARFCERHCDSSAVPKKLEIRLVPSFVSQSNMNSQCDFECLSVTESTEETQISEKESSAESSQSEDISTLNEHQEKRQIKEVKLEEIDLNSCYLNECVYEANTPREMTSSIKGIEGFNDENTDVDDKTMSCNISVATEPISSVDTEDYQIDYEILVDVLSEEERTNIMELEEDVDDNLKLYTIDELVCDQRRAQCSEIENNDQECTESFKEMNFSPMPSIRFNFETETVNFLSMIEFHQPVFRKVEYKIASISDRIHYEEMLCPNDDNTVNYTDNSTQYSLCFEESDIPSDCIPQCDLLTNIINDEKTKNQDLKVMVTALQDERERLLEIIQSLMDEKTNEENFAYQEDAQTMTERTSDPVENNQEIQESRSENKQLKENISVLQNERNQLLEENKSMKNKVSIYIDQRTKILKEFEDLLQQKAETEKNMKQLNEDHRRKTTKIAKLKQAIVNMGNHFEAMNSQKEKLTAILLKLKTRNRQLRKKLMKYDALIEDMNQDINKCKNSLDRNTIELTQSQNKYNELMALKQKLEKDFRKMRDEFASIKIDVEALRLENSNLINKAEQQAQEKNDLITSLNAKEILAENMQTEVACAMQKLEIVEYVRKELESTCEEQRIQLSQALAELREARENVELLTSKTLEYETLLENMKNENDLLQSKYREQLKESKDQMTLINCELEDKTQQLKRSREESDDLRKTLQQDVRMYQSQYAETSAKPPRVTNTVYSMFSKIFRPSKKRCRLSSHDSVLIKDKSNSICTSVELNEKKIT